MRKTWTMCEFTIEYIAYIKMQRTKDTCFPEKTETNTAHSKPLPETKESQFNNAERRPTTN